MSLVLAGVLPPFSLNLWQDIQVILSYDFMRQGLLAGTILSLVAGLVGYFVVLRHQAFAGESLSDVAFTGDVAIGTVLAWVLGLGVFFLTLFTSHVSGTGTGFSGITVLFGNILGTSTDQVRNIAIISGVTVLILLLIARPLLFASLDPDIAAARGVPVRLLSLGFMVLLAVTVSEATLAVGALLVFALLLLPAAIAYQLTTRPFVALTLAAGLAVLFTWLGIAIGFYTGYPSSVCISLLAFVVYVAVVGSTGRMTKAMRRKSEVGPA